MAGRIRTPKTTTQVPGPGNYNVLTRAAMAKQSPSYRHQFFAFLVYSAKEDKMSIMLLELPSLFERLSDPKFEYERDCQILLHKISMLDLIKGVEFLECKIP